MMNDKPNEDKYKSVIRRCIECDSTKFFHDYKLHETSCLSCGLVLYAPYSADFITDGFKFEKRCFKMYKLNKKDLDESKRRLSYYDFDSDADYSKYILELKT